MMKIEYQVIDSERRWSHRLVLKVEGKPDVEGPWCGYHGIATVGIGGLAWFCATEYWRGTFVPEVIYSFGIQRSEAPGIEVTTVRWTEELT